MLRGYAVPDVRAVEDRVRAGLGDGELMQRAARGLAHVVAERARARRARHVVVLAGPGDNGGDALWAAALLAREGLLDDGPARDGLMVVGVAHGLHEAGQDAAERAGVQVHLVDPDADLAAEVARTVSSADLVVDGLLGIGGRPGLRGAMAQVVAAVRETAYVVAVDLPSGADPAGEAQLGTAVHADETVTFGVAKPVHLLPATADAVGRLTVVDIGLALHVSPVVERLQPDDVATLWPVPGRQDHKYSRGVVGVVAGSDRYPGAAVLCSTAALESGAGMVRYVGPQHATDLVLAACPEVVPGPGRVQAAVVGPGIDPQGCDHEDCEDHQVERVREALGEDVPLVVDAGAVQLLATWLDSGHRRPAPTLLTPHAGELAGLLTAMEDGEVTREQVEAAPLEHARRAAALTSCTVLLKGATTLVVDPDPEVPVRAQADAPPWLATAGAGDVLAGLAGVLLAAGLEARDAGSLAALVHGLAAHRANPGGPLRALAVAHSIPSTVAALLTG
ncbi:bifunctional ADP-dependent NAD(P)H-hydrate dehydratase/NAD(P)H-hydrate epimerase [Ornithinimicrobium avium]|uniref:Bifunctional NAD(P)H-hydrate repair enzyme n=1 Tax=Ornithinimicrobium avium TaxID=2283195 RepID=A0A345NQN4_9MICO|nr:bifunctional ADP-dependent NAD(P)H-hydrate dehydratase/NAD(P)H-hydrate epimerase [Ornithinimicrobium avium]AXH97342.1 bifunctional ADP-dependent NAD(P)H-hydrate dehydratase/NAD(P)H-hydrate epimerase [Ornithinimicrobium avium]